MFYFTKNTDQVSRIVSLTRSITENLLSVSRPSHFIMGQSHSNAAADAADDAAAADDASADAALKVAAAAERVAACLVKKVVSATVRSVVEKTAPLYTYEERYSRITGQWYFEATNINWVAHGTLPTGCIASLKKPSYVGARAVGILTESEIDAAIELTEKRFPK